MLVVKWSQRLKFIFLAIVVVLASLSQVSSGRAEGSIVLPPKILILYSSIGMGHLSAARAISEQIKAKNPNSEVILKDIRDFEGKISHYVGEKGFWFIVKNFPDLFDRMFRNVMTTGNLVPYLSLMKSSYDEGAIYKYVKEIHPTAILATHYGSAQSIGNLREKGLLREIPVGWLHTDYFKGYFPRISKRIEQTFVGMKAVEKQWLEAGVDAQQVVNTGIPVNPKALEPITPEQKEQVLTQLGFDPRIKTIVLASGGEGVGDFPLIVKKLNDEIKEPLQVIAVCAKNEDHFNNLNNLKPELRSDFNLRVEKFVPNLDLLNYIKSSDIYITKSGGLSPTEGFAITKPIVLLDVYGGHERDNAKLFEKEGLAIVNKNQADIAQDVQRLLSNKDLVTRMLNNQLEFRNSLNFQAIADFALAPKFYAEVPGFHLGIESGEEATQTVSALAKLDQDSPADIEILLGYGKSKDGKYIAPNNDSNPFGHLAIRIKDRVYTANGRAVFGEEKQLLHETSMQEYLFGVTRPTKNMEHTDSFGSSYGRDTISLRVNGLPQEAIEKMLSYISETQALWEKGEASWHKSEFNCADYVLNILRAGGFAPETTDRFIGKNKKITLPLEVLDSYRDYFDRRLDFRSELVSYIHVVDSQNLYKTTRFPLSFYQIRRSLKNLLFNQLDPMETLVDKRIAFYAGDRRAHYENINGESKEKEDQEKQKVQQALATTMEEMRALETQLEIQKGKLSNYQLTAADVKSSIEQVLATLTADEKELALSTKEFTNPDELKVQRVKNLKEKINAWNAQQTSMDTVQDQLLQMELDYFIDSVQFSLQSLHQQVSRMNDLNAKLKQQFTDVFELAQLQFNKYKENKNQYGQPKDGPLRTDPYRSFFSAAKNYFDLANTDLIQSQPQVKSMWIHLKTNFIKAYTRTLLVIRVVPKALAMLVRMWTSPVTPKGHAPILENMTAMFTSAAKTLGYKVRIEGAENLPRSEALSSKRVHVIAMTHRDPVRDAFAMASLGLDKALLVFAPDQIAPKSIADQMLNVDSLVSVGRRSDLPIEQILAQLERQKSNTILIYPEGSVSAGIFETRPLREKFSWGLIKRLQDVGYEVDVVPVTYKNTAKFLHENSIAAFLKSTGQPSTGENKTLEVKVDTPLTHEAVRFLTSTAGSAALNRFLRASWHENLTTDRERLNGALRPEVGEQMIREQFSLKQAPLLRKSKSPESKFMRPRRPTPAEKPPKMPRGA